MGNIVPSHLMDRNLFDFAGLKASGVADAGGDRAFDADDCGDSATGQATVQPAAIRSRLAD